MTRLFGFILGMMITVWAQADMDSIISTHPVGARLQLEEELKKTEDTSQIVSNLLYQSKLEYVLGNYPLALRLAIDAKEYLGKTDKRLGKVYLAESRVYLANNQWQKAASALKKLDKLNLDVIEQARKWLDEAEIAYINGEFEKAQRKGLRALAVFKTRLYWLGRIEALIQLSDIYLAKGRLDLAKSCAQKAHFLAQEKNANVYKAKATLQLANHMHLLNATDSANVYLKEAILLSQKTGALNILRDTYFAMYSIATDSKRPEEALQYYQYYTSIGDSLFNMNRSREIAALDATYQIQQERKDNQLLRQEKALRDTEIVRRRRMSWIYLGAAILLLVAVVVTIVFFMKSRKANQRLLLIAHQLKQKRDKLKLATKNLKLANSRLIGAQKKILQQKDEVERAAKAKDVFLSSVSHELRTPLNAILGLTDELLERDQEVTQRENLEIIKFSGGNLLTLVNDILDYNKIEAGKIEFEIIDFNLKETLSKIRKALVPKARQNNVELVLNYDVGISEWFKGDPVRIGQVFNNLLSNAIKFTKDGQVEINVVLEKVDSERHFLNCDVKDHGIGIPQDKLQSIFERFTQASSDTTRKYGGTGLGLAITKRLLELMGGEIQVESQVGVGTRFYFNIGLPVGKPPKPQRELSELELPRGLKILAADDNPANRILAKRVLKSQPVELVMVNDGMLAFEAFKSGDFDMILTDIHMPNMDGLEFTKAVREFDPEIPILALTGSMTETLEGWRSRGFNDFLHKPYTKRELFELIIKNVPQERNALQ